MPGSPSYRNISAYFSQWHSIILSLLFILVVLDNLKKIRFLYFFFNVFYCGAV